MNIFFDSKEFEDKFHYSGSDLGAIYKKEKTTFKVWSPLASKVTLQLYKNGDKGQPIKEIAMELREKGIWNAEVNEDLKNVYYTYQVKVNDVINEAVDP